MKIIKPFFLAAKSKKARDALELLKKLRGQGLTASTDEDDKGRIKVIVSRKELMEKNMKESQ